MDRRHTGVAREEGAEQASYSLWQLVRYFLRLGTLGFGGPVALVGYMQRDLGRCTITDSPTLVLALVTLILL